MDKLKTVMEDTLHLQKQNDIGKKALFVFICANGVLHSLLGYAFLAASLSSSRLFTTPDLTFNAPTTQAFIVAVNVLMYVSFIGLPTVLSGFGLTLVLRKKFTRTWVQHLVIWMYTALTFSLLIDSYVFKLFHFHLSLELLALSFHHEFIQVLPLSRIELVAAITALMVFYVGEYYLLKGCFYLTRHFSWPLTISYVVALSWGLSFLISTQLLLITTHKRNNIFSQQLSNLPFGVQLFRIIAPTPTKAFIDYYSEYIIDLKANDRFYYPKRPLACPKPKSPYNIVLITVDSLRADVVNPINMPYLAQFANHHLNFANHYSGGNATQPGLFSLFYAIPPSYWQTALNTKTPPVLTHALKQWNYDLKVIWSTSMRHPKVTETVYSDFDNVRLTAAPGKQSMDKDKHTTLEAITYLTQQTSNKRPFFLTILYDSLHAFCRTDKYKEIYQPSIKDCHHLQLNNATDPAPFFNRYRNIAYFIDGQIELVLTTLKKQGLLDKTVVILTSDHGQEFNDTKQNFWGHTSNFSPYQLKVPMVIGWPGKAPSNFNHLTSHYDIAPTLLTHLFQCSNPMTDHSIGESLFSSRKRQLFVSSYTDHGLIADNRVTVIKRSGEIITYDREATPLNITADPNAIRQLLYLEQSFHRH